MLIAENADGNSCDTNFDFSPLVEAAAGRCALAEQCAAGRVAAAALCTACGTGHHEIHEIFFALACVRMFMQRDAGAGLGLLLPQLGPA